MPHRRAARCRTLPGGRLAAGLESFGGLANPRLLIGEGGLRRGLAG